MRLVEWRLKPKTLKDSEIRLMSKEELQKEGLQYIKKLTDEGETIEEIIETENKLIIKLKD